MVMRVLADTNLFFKFCRWLPLPPAVESALADENNEVCVATQAGKLPNEPKPDNSHHIVNQLDALVSARN
jgi:hypothetical protein